MPTGYGSPKTPSLVNFQSDGTEQTAGSGGGWDVENWYFAAAASAGDWVMVDESETTGEGAYRSAEQTDTTIGQTTCLGVVLDSPAAGEWARVLRQGVITPNTLVNGAAISVNVATAVVAGDGIVSGDSVAGRAIATATLPQGTVERLIGVSLDGSTANVSGWVDVRCRS